MSSPSSSAQAAREALAHRLRDLRLDAGLSSRSLAAAAGWHEAKTSRIEHVHKAPSEADLAAWPQACGVPELLPELIHQLRAADIAWLDWRKAERTGVKQLNLDVRALYERTKTLRIYSSAVIPTPVQTAEYVTAVLSSVRLMRGVEIDDVAAAVAERMARQHILYEGDHRFVILLEQTALTAQVGGPRVHAGQLRHLLAVIGVPSLVLGVIPATVDRSLAQWPAEMFFAFDEAQVSVELVSGFLNISNPHEIKMYLKAFASLATQAVYGADARNLIEQALATIEDPQGPASL
ncbi:helix-turn-helix domain-containing protein [Nonomuraea typhae]|uniref:Helix-turn-helix domain-containing protein n=1 Tax=Nonomuraea typhae TaxID=2603600 RepID=A0ABW7YW57_9ACTN